jgi:hypothetical protein
LNAWNQIRRASLLIKGLTNQNVPFIIRNGKTGLYFGDGGTWTAKLEGAKSFDVAYTTIFSLGCLGFKGPT